MFNSLADHHLNNYEAASTSLSTVIRQHSVISLSHQITASRTGTGSESSTSCRSTGNPESTGPMYRHLPLPRYVISPCYHTALLSLVLSLHSTTARCTLALTYGCLVSIASRRSPDINVCNVIPGWYDTSDW